MFLIPKKKYFINEVKNNYNEEMRDLILLSLGNINIYKTRN